MLVRLGRRRMCVAGVLVGFLVVARCMQCGCFVVVGCGFGMVLRCFMMCFVCHGSLFSWGAKLPTRTIAHP
jgi:hypothetical protein